MPTKTLALDPGVLGKGSSASLQLSGATDADILSAVATNRPFPVRPAGRIDLASIGLSASGGKPVVFEGGQATLELGLSAGVTAEAGIFDDPGDVIASLGLEEAPGMALTPAAGEAGSRFALLRASYEASARVAGSHPAGMLGSATLGVSGAAKGLSAVIHRFPAQQGARDVLEETVTSWKLPRHVTAADALAPATWVVAEADGTLAVKLAASLGYDFTFVREAKLAGLSGDVGLKIDAAATASFGLEVSGRYLVVVGRDSDDAAAARVRLQLFKMSANGMRFGANLKLGVTGVADVLPGRVDDFTRAVFGVHGTQVAKSLQLIEHWTDRTKSVGELVAGLVNEKALELLEHVTGVDPQAAFDGARARLVEAINLYQGLPSRVSSELWGVLKGLNGPAAAALEHSVALLASADEKEQRAELLRLLEAQGFSSTPEGRILSSLADAGLLNLLDRLPELRRTAAVIHAVLDGGIVKKLQDWLEERLSLDDILQVATEADFEKLDSLLVGRLSHFFDRKLEFADLREIKDTVNLVVAKRTEIYEQARKALTSRYGFELAAAWSQTTSRTAVLDVEFDTARARGRELLAAVLRDSRIDTLVTTPDPAVRLRKAVLSHEVTRKTSLELSLPHLSFQSASVNRGLATMRAEAEGGRILLYDASGTDVVQVRNRYQSSLSVTIAASASPAGPAATPHLRVYSLDSATWTYQLLQAREAMGREELEAFTRPFVMKYLRGQFQGDTHLSLWYRHLDDAVEEVLHNGKERFGDVCASYEVTIPGAALTAWAKPVEEVTSATKRMSTDIQRSLKKVLSFYYLQDVGRLKTWLSSAALLAWASLRPTNDLTISGDALIFDAGDKVFWDYLDPRKREVMVLNPIARQSLLRMLPALRLRLEEAKLHGLVQFYEDAQAGALLRAALEGVGDILLRSLLQFEAQIVRKAAEALKNIQQFRAAAGTSPSKALELLAEFAADITGAFNKLAGQTPFGGETLRSVGQAVFADASRSLDGTLDIPPRAMLTLTVLRPAQQREFVLGSFLAGAVPGEKDVVLEQRLVSGPLD